MAIGPMSFRRIGFEEANPFLTGALKSQQLAMGPQQYMQQALMNQKLQAELPYVPITALSNAASKAAYASLLAPQTMSKFLTPELLENLPAEQRQMLLNSIGNNIAAVSEGGQFNPWAILNRFNPNAQSQSNAPAAAMNVPSNNWQEEANTENNFEQPIGSFNTGAIDNNPDIYRADVNENLAPTQTALPPLPGMASSNRPFGAEIAERTSAGTGGGQSPSASAETIKETNKILAQEEAKGFTEGRREQQKNSTEAANLAKLMEKELERFQTNYDKLGTARTGPILGQIPGVLSNEAQAADSAAEAMKAQAAALYAGNKLTNAKLETIGETKPSRLLDPEAEKSTADSYRSLIALQKEYKPYVTQAQKTRKSNGELLSADEIDVLWLASQDIFSNYNPKTGSLNLENTKKWRDILDDPEAIDTLLSGNNPWTQQVSNAVKEEQTKQNAKVRVFNPQTGRLE